MKETEQFNGPLTYRDAMPMLNEEARPVSEGDLDTLVGSMSLWYDDFYHFHKALVEKYGLKTVAKTKLHHILSGSSISLAEWEELDSDTDGGELGEFVSQICEKFGEQDEVKEAAA